MRLHFLRMPLFVVGLLAGCSNQPATYPVTGKVVFADGRPLAGGWVEFEQIGRQSTLSARGEIQQDGTFRLGTFQTADGAVEGEHRAVVIPMPPATNVDNPLALPPLIDRRFADFEQSRLRFQVSQNSKENHFEIEVHPPN